MKLEDIAKKLSFKPFKLTKDEWGSLNPSKDTPIRAGTVLKLKKGRGVRLVGNVNVSLGVCDDCVEFGIEEIHSIAYLDELLE